MNAHNAIKRWWQRRTRGWDDSETWSLDYSLAKLILTRLVRFKELENGWGEPDLAKIENGLGLFAKHYRELWW